MEPFRRVTGNGGKWFTLCSWIGDDDKDAFVIGNELRNFARSLNDLDGYYGNNSGYLKLRSAFRSRGNPSDVSSPGHKPGCRWPTSSLRRRRIYQANLASLRNDARLDAVLVP